LKYKYLNRFDEAMIALLKGTRKFASSPIEKVWDSRGDQVVAFTRRNLTFVFNFNPTRSFTDYGLLVKSGKYHVVLNSDESQFGGYDRVDEAMTYEASVDPLYEADKKGWLRLYLPARSAMVLVKK
jgi:1,4-alpha-glucan branching enzyme